MRISAGSWRLARNSAACTSAAAASMSRLGSNSSEICVSPWMLVELLVTRPGMEENCFSSGVATDEAMLSGLAPARLAPTWIVGVSYLGSAEIGKFAQQITPATTALIQNSRVAIGRWRQAWEMFIEPLPKPAPGERPPSRWRRCAPSSPA